MKQLLGYGVSVSAKRMRARLSFGLMSAMKYKAKPGKSLSEAA